MRRTTTILAVLLVAGAARGAPEDFNVDIAVGWDGCYRPMEWTPVDVTIHHKLVKPLGGRLSMTGQQDGLTELTVQRDIVLTPQLPLPVHLATKLAYGASDLKVVMNDQGGKVCWRKEISLWGAEPDMRRLIVVRERDLLIALAGRGDFGLRDLPKAAASVGLGGARGKVYVCGRLPRMLPNDWTGYASLDLLILYDPDWDTIGVQQERAICRWVRNGGRLLILLGSHPLPEGRDIVRLLPCKVGEARGINIPSTVLRRWGCRSGERKLAGMVTARRLEPGGGEIVHLDIEGRPEPVFASGPAGFGLVGVVPFDPSTTGGLQGQNLAPFWVETCRPLLDRRSLAHVPDGPADRENSDDYRFELGRDSQAANQVMEHLLSIPELRPLSIWWIIGLLALLAVLIGPADYLFLRAIDRLPLTWATSSLCIVLFSAGAYYGVEFIRAGSTQVRAVSVVDGIEGAAGGWSTTYAGIFASSSGDYRLTDGGGGGLRGDQWWSAVSPTLGDEIYTWNRETAARDLYCAQQDFGNLPVSVPINIWSMQCLVNESSVDALPLGAAVRRRGEEWSVTIANRSDAPVTDGRVMIGERGVLMFGAVPPGTTKTFTGRPAAGPVWRDYLLRGYQNGMTPVQAAAFAPGAEQRTRALAGYLRRGAAIVCANYAQAPAPFAVERRKSRHDHLLMARLVVFPPEEASP